MICPKCGSETRDDSTACASCGTPIERPAEPVAAPAPAPAAPAEPPAVSPAEPPMTPEQQAARKAALGKLLRLVAAAVLIVAAIAGLYWLFRDPFSFDVPSARPDLGSPKEAALSYAEFHHEAEFLELETEVERISRSLEYLRAQVPYLTDNRKVGAEKEIKRQGNKVEQFRKNRDALKEVKLEFVKEENENGIWVVQIKSTGKSLEPDGEEGWKLVDVEPRTTPWSLTKIDGRWRIR